MDGVVVDAAGEKSALPMIARLVGQLVGLKPDEVVPNLKYSEDENAEAAELSTLIKTYVNESMTRFIVGDLDVDDDAAWETYKSELRHAAEPLDRAGAAVLRPHDQVIGYRNGERPTPLPSSCQTSFDKPVDREAYSPA